MDELLGMKDLRSEQRFNAMQMVQLKTMNQMPQEQKDEIFLASVQMGDLIELPSFIFVDTRFITKNSGELAEISAELDSMEVFSMNQKDSPAPSAKSLRTDLTSEETTQAAKKTFANAKVCASVVQKECGTDPENPNPVRTRGQQTEELRTKTVGVQCCMEKELFFDLDENQEVVEKEPDCFLFASFFCENSISHSSGKIECRICGEVVLDSNEMESHLELHYGPRALCFRCGHNFQHEIELQRHVCDAGECKSVSPAFHCPHYRCNVVAISKLELYDHINEHCSDDCYKCACCGNTYPTATELLQHARLRKRCSQFKLRFPYKKLHLRGKRNLRNRLRVQVIYKSNGARALRVLRLDKCSILTPTRQCQICFKISSNDFKYRRHRTRCLSLYRSRYRKKCEKEQIFVLQDTREF